MLVLGELMGQGKEKQEGITRSAIPLTAGAIVTAQFTMAVVTHLGGECTEKGWGRKPLFLIGLASLPIRCALIILLKDAGHQYLVATQLLDGIGGGLFGLIHPYIVADITFGTGRFNALSKYPYAKGILLRFFEIILNLFSCFSLFIVGLTASAFGMGATLSNYLGQKVVEHVGHVASLVGSLVISIVPIVVFVLFMPETLGKRGSASSTSTRSKSVSIEV